MNIIKNRSIQVRLDAAERFPFTTRTGEIMVDHIKFTPANFKPDERGRHARARGSAIKKDGSLALIDRQDNIPFSEIPPHILQRVVNEFNANERVSL